ncbi:hypothetical protein ACP70R_027297 [Stipagrostis hirtigluma subsp. patula]
MAASEVEAMRRAYAGIMLNMAQESAARVLAAERRAAALAGRAAAAKDDGVATLLRLKAIMEARIKEVELQSVAHVQKIKELEEQLHGAQNTVASLQVELQRANTELEQTRKTLAEERINILPTCNKIDSYKSTSARSKKHLQGGIISLKNKKAEDNTCLIPVTAMENGAAQNLENKYRCSPDPPSFMERNKKPKLYHSGCTQRIHALKQRTQGADTLLEQNRKQATALNSHSRTGKNVGAKNPHQTRSIMEQILETKFLGKCKRKRGRRSRPSYKLNNSSEHGEAEYKLSDSSDGNGCLLLLQALEQDLSPPKMSAGNGREALTDLKDGLLTSRTDADLNLRAASPELKDVLALNNMQMQKRKRSKTVRVLEVDFSDSKSVPESGNTVLRSTSEKSMSDSEWGSEMKEIRSDSPPRNNDPVIQCTTKNLMHQTDANNDQFKSENSLVLLQCAYGNSLMDQLEHSMPDNNCASWKEVNEDGICSLASDIADVSTIGSLDQEEKLKVSSRLPMQASEKSDASIGSSLNKEEHAKASSGASVQAEGARQIKYTFNRRKRKCMSLDSTQCAVPEKSSDLVSTPKKQEPHPNPEAQEPLESPEGENQLAQVAQQLILLSEQTF